MWQLQEFIILLDTSKLNQGALCKTHYSMLFVIQGLNEKIVWSCKTFGYNYSTILQFSKVVKTFKLQWDKIHGTLVYC